jgi:response regulator RpfG family c-di-GMP phosphodiesterase
MKFAQKKTEENPLSKETWKILICDDEKEVHTITKTVLSDFVFKNKKLEFVSAYSGTEAVEILSEENDIALILLDVVMETDYAGLDVVKDIREKLNNKLIRIILRTGQPGYAPEKEVIQDYDINDYKEKTELTDMKLFTSVISALRAYKYMRSLERNRSGLEKIIHATRNIYEKNSLENFSSGVLSQIVSLLRINGHSLLLSVDGLTLEKDISSNDFKILASTGTYSNKTLEEIMTAEFSKLLQCVLESKESTFTDNAYISYSKTDTEKINIIYVEGCHNIEKLDKDLINIFANNVSIAFNNLYLNKEIIDTQKELIETLGETVERRSKEASNHVRRVANISYELALKFGLSEEESILIRNASPMHDVGKIGIRDSILLKPGILDDAEFEIMKTHATIGRDILGNSHRAVLKAASIIAYEHHEKYDGSGYPNKVAGDDIHIYGRITAVADVFDALLNKRCYKEAWDIEKVIEHFTKKRNVDFDGKLVDILLENIDFFKKIVDNDQ